MQFFSSKYCLCSE